jgi:type II secretory pathway pseudopilin PulG
MPPYGYQQNPYGTPVGPQMKTGLALASMIIGIVAFPLTFVLIGILLAPVAVILGIVALRKAAKQPHVYGGKGFAIAGIAVGSVVGFLIVPMIAAIAIPNLLAARRAANEGSAVSAVRTIAIAQATYSSMNGDGACGDLTELASRKLIAGELATGRKNGYRFEAKGSIDEDHACEVLATPESKSHGTRSFYYSSEDETLRMTQDGSPADHNDQPVETLRSSN